MREDQEANLLIYHGSFLSIGQFRCGPVHSKFKGSHQIGGTLMVFPRTGVIITHAGQEPVVADSNKVMFYNDGQIYSRGKLSDKGDLCEWFKFDSRLVTEAIRSFDPYVDDHPCQPFQFSHAPSDPTSYLLQRLVVDHILNTPDPDPLFIEETVMHILRRVIVNSYRQQGTASIQQKGASDREVAEALQKALALCFEQNPSLEQLSQQLNYSPFYLCRTFRKHTGISIHRYLNQLRLRASLESVTQANSDLSRLAMQLGFASHSHFTEAFRKTFGTAPSSLRNKSQQEVRQLLSKISIA
jgi:AraC-like DNA-binding protein